MKKIAIKIIISVAVVFASGCASTSGGLTSDSKLQLANTRTETAMEYYRLGKKKAAYQDIRQALALKPNHSMANNFMGIMQWFTFKEYKLAEKHFRRAIASDKTNATAYMNLGSLLCERGRIDAAIPMFDKAIKNQLYPNRALASENAGACLMRKPAPVRAETYFRKALQVRPKLSKSLYFMAKISYEGNRIVSAKGFLQRYMQIRRTKATSDILLLAVKIESASGNRNKAASYAFKLRNTYPDSPAAKKLKRLRY